MDVAGMGFDFDFDDLEVTAGTGMSPEGSAMSAVAAAGSEDEGDLRRGPWTVEEDVLLVNYVANHGEGRWNSLARSAGLKRTGKSCRLRWLNYLRPDVRRGNITASEQLLILELHSRWGNRWSKIAQHLPGRTDNEIKNYWRTRVQKHAKQLRCDVNSAQFRDVVRCVWMPRLLERIQAESSSPSGSCADGDAAAAVSRQLPAATTTVSAPAAYHMSCAYQQSVAVLPPNKAAHGEWGQKATAAASPDDTSSSALRSSTTEASHAGANDNTLGTTPMSEGGAVQCGGATGTAMGGDDVFGGSWSDLLATASGRDEDTMVGLPDFDQFGEFEDNLWSLEDLCLQQQYCN